VTIVGGCGSVPFRGPHAQQNEGGTLGNEQDVFEWRRYGHWDSSAAKARLSAYVLWRVSTHPILSEFAGGCGHTGDDAGLGVLEAFRRESAIALELVVKAVIAKKLRSCGADPATQGIPATHDLPKLWNDAGLPPVSGEDLYRLHLAKSRLVWQGRYPAPRTVKAWEEEAKEFLALQDPPLDGQRFQFRTPISIGWDDFDRLYQIAYREL
jgi:hypothetical protein